MKKKEKKVSHREKLKVPRLSPRSAEIGEHLKKKGKYLTKKGKTLTKKGNYLAKKSYLAKGSKTKLSAGKHIKNDKIATNILNVDPLIHQTKKLEARKIKKYNRLENRRLYFQKIDEEDYSRIQASREKAEKLIVKLKENRKIVEAQIAGRRQLRKEEEEKALQRKLERDKKVAEIIARRTQRIQEAEEAELRRIERAKQAEVDFKEREARRYQEQLDSNVEQKLLYEEEIEAERRRIRNWDAQNDINLRQSLRALEEKKKWKLTNALFLEELNIRKERRKAAKATLKHHLRERLAKLRED